MVPAPGAGLALICLGLAKRNTPVHERCMRLRSSRSPVIIGRLRMPSEVSKLYRGLARETYIRMCYYDNAPRALRRAGRCFSGDAAGGGKTCLARVDFAQHGAALLA